MEYQNTCPFSAIFEIMEFQMLESKIENHRLKMMLQKIVAKIGNDTNLKQEKNMTKQIITITLNVTVFILIYFHSAIYAKFYTKQSVIYFIEIISYINYG